MAPRYRRNIRSRDLTRRAMGKIRRPAWYYSRKQRIFFMLKSHADQSMGTWLEWKGMLPAWGSRTFGQGKQHRTKNKRSGCIMHEALHISIEIILNICL
jgi:hypothetical protein